MTPSQAISRKLTERLVSGLVWGLMSVQIFGKRLKILATSPKFTFQTLACGLAVLTSPPQGYAQDDTNAALVTDPSVRSQIHQLMGGTSTQLPNSAAGPIILILPELR